MKVSNKKHRVIKTYEVRLTKLELLHIRDLFNVRLPPDGDKTVSVALAEAEGRPVIESGCWRKFGPAFEAAGVEVGDAAPDHMVIPTGMAPMTVMPIASEPQDEDEDEQGQGSRALDDLATD